VELVEKTDQRITFRFHPSGKDQLLSILNCFPLPSKWEVTLSKNDHEGELEEDRKFLEESLDSERQSLQSTLDTFLNSPVTFYEEDGQNFLRLGLDKVEWLLQILNDIRISSWQLLGSPGPEDKENLEKLIQDEIPEESMQQAQLFLLLELAGYYQSVVIESLDRPNLSRDEAENQDGDDS